MVAHWIVLELLDALQVYCMQRTQSFVALESVDLACETKGNR